MAEDWAADVKRYAPDADDGVIAGIIRYCGIALQKRDSSLVSFADPTETGRVRENFLKKKLGLTHADDELDRAIAAVGERMKGDNFKNRVTAYYLLADHFGMHHLFGKAGAAAAGTAAAAGAAGAAGLAALGGDHADPLPDPVHDVAHDPIAPVATAAAIGGTGAAATMAAAHDPAPVHADPVVAPEPQHFADQRTVVHHDDDDRGGMGWLWWLLGALLLGFLLWWLFFRTPADRDTAPAAAETTEAAAAPVATGTATAAPGDTVNLATAPAEGTVTIPAGAGVTVETRDAKPVVKVYFDTAKTDVAPAFGPAAAGLKDWLAAHPGSTLAISGYNDPTGNAAANAELSKNRAQAVQKALVAAGIAQTATDLVKPAAATDATVDKAAARRVEVVVR